MSGWLLPFREGKKKQDLILDYHPSQDKIHSFHVHGTLNSAHHSHEAFYVFLHYAIFLLA